MINVIVKPKLRQVLVIAERDKLIGFCLACRCRAERGEGQTIQLRQGLADGSALTDKEFASSKVEVHQHWLMEAPEAVIEYLPCPDFYSNPMDFAVSEATRRVT